MMSGDALRMQRLQDLKHVSAAFARWWLASISSCIPQGLKQSFKLSEPRLTLRFGRHERIWRIETGDKSVQLPGKPKSGISGSGTRKVAKSVDVFLTDDLVFQQSIDLPASAERALRQIVFNELDRQTPFAKDEVYFDCAVAARNEQKKTCNVKLVVVKPEIVAAATAEASLPSLVVRRIGHESPLGQQMNLSRGPVSSVSTGIRAVYFLLVTATLAVMAACVESRLRYLDNADRLLQSRIAEVRNAARQAEIVQNEIAAITKKLGFIAAQKEKPSPLQILNHLAVRIPDDSWIFQFSLVDREVRISGYSSNASALQETLAGDDRISDARFRSPVTRSSGAIDRFDMSLVVSSEQRQP